MQECQQPRQRPLGQGDPNLSVLLRKASQSCSRLASPRHAHTMSWRPLMSKRLYELRFTFKADDPRSAGLWYDGHAHAQHGARTLTARCPRCSRTRACRDYLQRYYAGDKHMNPTLPMLVRPHTVDEPPVISAMYGECMARINRAAPARRLRDNCAATAPALTRVVWTDEGHVEQRNVDGMSVDQVKKVMRELVELGSERSAHLLPAWQQPPHSL